MNITMLQSVVMVQHVHTPGGLAVMKVLGKLFPLGTQSSEF